MHPAQARLALTTRPPEALRLPAGTLHACQVGILRLPSRMDITGAMGRAPVGTTGLQGVPLHRGTQALVRRDAGQVAQLVTRESLKAVCGEAAIYLKQYQVRAGLPAAPRM